MTAEMSDATSGPLVPEQRGVRDAARGEILHRHARLTSHGHPILCHPSGVEVDGKLLPRQGVGSYGKVIYASRESAEAAARELESLGARALRSYRCEHARRGHYHLTTDAVAHTGHLPLHLRIPQQRS